MTTEGDQKAKPVPVLDELTSPFWEAARQHRLEIQRCRACGYYNHPPRPMCDQCASEHLAFEQVSGKGTIHSYTLMRQRNVVGFEDDVPYLNIIVELAEQPMLFIITGLAGTGPGQVRIGHEVEVWFEERAEGVTLPQFRLA